MSRPKDALPVTWAAEEHSPHLMTLLRNSPALLAAIAGIQEEVLARGERRLEQDIRKAHFEKGKFPRSLGLLKIAFWEEYRLAVHEKRNMRAEDIYHGICLRAYWQKSVIDNPLHLAWLIHAPADELILQKEIIQLGMQKLREAFDVPLYETKTVKTRAVGKDGKLEYVDKEKKVFNIALLRELHAITRSMQDRVHGSVIDRKSVQTKSLHVHAATGSLPPQQVPLSLDNPNLTLEDLEKIEAKILGIDARLQAAGEKHGFDLSLPPGDDEPDVIDV